MRFPVILTYNIYDKREVMVCPDDNALSVAALSITSPESNVTQYHIYEHVDTYTKAEVWLADRGEKK